MKRLICATAIAVAAIATPAFAADVGVSITVGSPGFFGRIELGDFRAPPVLYTRPVVIVRPPRGVVVEPIYLRVPPGHSKNWKKYCARYDACGRPVYFVKDDWYRNVYAPRYRKEHREHFREERHEDHGNKHHERHDEANRGDKKNHDRH